MSSMRLFSISTEKDCYGRKFYIVTYLLQKDIHIQFKSNLASFYQIL